MATEQQVNKLRQFLKVNNNYKRIPPQSDDSQSLIHDWLLENFSTWIGLNKEFNYFSSKNKKPPKIKTIVSLGI